MRKNGTISHGLWQDKKGADAPRVCERRRPLAKMVPMEDDVTDPVPAEMQAGARGAVGPTPIAIADERVIFLTQASP